MNPADELYFNKSGCSICDNTTAGGSCEIVCDEVADLVLGIVHLVMGVVGFIVNTLALYLFYKMGKQKPYYIVIVFETFTDLVVCLTALYSACFLLSGRDDWFQSLSPLCEIAGMVWNWNMVITPLLLSVAGLMRLHAVYYPHSAFLDRNSKLVVGLCVFAYIYGVAYAFFPYYFDNFKYEFKNVRSNCDFVLDAEGDNAKEIGSLYFALMGPIPMFLSLLLIIVTNSVIVIYIMKRYKSSWNRKKSRKSRKQGSFGSFIINMDQKVQSKQVIVSLLMMTGWYMMCYSIIIYCNFKNFINYWKHNNTNIEVTEQSSTYFYATYNFLAYLNSFVNPFILLTTGSSFRQELGRLSLRIRNKCGLISHKSSKAASLQDTNNGTTQRRTSLPLIQEQGEI